ncbi:unnamed protein product [Ectocarpus fasciculatus]
MRWCFGRCTVTPFFSRKTPDATAVDVAPSNRTSTTTSSLPTDGGVYNHQLVRSIESGATEADRTRDAGVDEIYCATAASCPVSRGRPAHESTAIGTLRSGVPDGLSSSLISFVEGVTLQPQQSRPSPPERVHCRSRSTGRAIGGDGGGEKSCARRLASAAYFDYSPTVGGDESKIPATAGTASSAAPSPLPTTSITTEKDDQLVAEIHDHILRRGVVVDNFVALGAARVCLALMLSREAKLEEIAKTGLPELVSLARSKLDLSAGAAACLLAQLIDSEMTAARLADPNLRVVLGGIRSSGTFCAEKKSPFWSRHHPSKEGVHPAASGVEATQAAQAALALSEACRMWRETIGAVNNTARGIDASSETRRLPLVSSSAKSARSPGYRRCSLEPPRNLYRPPPGEGGVFSAAPTVEGVAGVAARQGGGKQHVRHLLQQAIRVVTSGANNSYGQLVVLGYKEFSVRDSTWHRVGPKNARFILARRESPNGVQVGSSSGNGGGSGSGSGANDGVYPVHKNDTDGSSPSCCQGGMASPCRNTHTNQTLAKPAEGNEYDDDGGSVRSTKNIPGDRCGKQVAFKTPEARPTESCGGRNPPHRWRGGEGGVGGTNARVPRNGGVSGGAVDGDSENRGGRSFSLRSAQGESQNHAAGYRLHLSLSAQQREAAGRVGRGRASTTQAPAETVGGWVDDVVDVPCRADDGCDMFQLGRMQSAENDFAVRGPLHQPKPGGKVCGPVSRYAVRLLVDRSPPHRCRIFTAGFNSRKCLTLPESSPKWLEDTGEWDAVTPFGIRILKPEIGEWREVTVAGAIRRLRAAGRLDTIGDLVPGETNELTSGTIIDIGGVQMLYESAQQMARLGGVQPSQVIELLNDRKPQCPVQLQTLQFKPWQPPPISSTPSETGGASGDAAVATAAAAGAAADGVVGAEDVGEINDAQGNDGDTEGKALVPHIFPACGHVQGYAKQLAWGPCPMCRTPGPLVEIKFGWCSAIDREVPTVVFNPCGHAASLEVAERWSRLAMPNNAPPDAVYRPICPYCAKPLQCKDGERPYSKMIFVQ